VLSRRRELILLRDQVAQAMALEARQRPLLATAAGAATSATAASAAASIPAPEPARTIYRARKRWRRGVLAAAGVLIAALLAVLAVHFLYAY